MPCDWLFACCYAHPSINQALVLLLAEDGDELVLAAWKGCEAVAATIPKENQVREVLEGEGGRESTQDS